jgi:hypothetical protein
MQKLIGADKVNKEYESMLVGRKEDVLSYFGDKKAGDKVTFEHGVSVVPPTGFSHYIFNYKGEKPEELTKK